MQPAGLEAFAARDPRKTPRQPGLPKGELPPRYEAGLRRNRAAWDFWRAQTERYRQLAAGFVMAGKRDETQARRFAALLASSAAGRRLDPMNPFRDLT
jgi:hypothetical protein